MTTAEDLFMIAMGPENSVGQGDLSLALAGAELIDLIGAGAVVLDSDRIVPNSPPPLDDRFLGEAAAGLTRQVPYERVEDWLWRRGRDLSAAYQTALEQSGVLTPQRSGRLPIGSKSLKAADTPARRRAADRWNDREPTLTALAAAVGIGEEPSGEGTVLDDEAVTSVVASVHDAVMELEAVRQRRTIENQAFANLWRGP
ncbi:Golgi phosphoprotein 3 GPP34 [Streptomyces sp. BK208]|uniref:GOLPH3/VPS74 family protein n=1 Tax=Streptomyces sp. BK208 TaxID=2512150 RepID=UPI00105DC4EB|nr:GPP34 family phosphoprotein [Streptomyces sp. BK208]TDT42069.1 Golgi phosphoprotein 3 GPP34 [Streptomyces sp. BK208]